MVSINFKWEGGPILIPAGGIFEITFPVISAVGEITFELQFNPSKDLSKGVYVKEIRVPDRDHITISKAFQVPQTRKMRNVNCICNLIAKVGESTYPSKGPRALIFPLDDFFETTVKKELEELTFTCERIGGKGKPKIIAETSLLSEKFDIECTTVKRYTVNDLNGDYSKFLRYKKKYGLTKLKIITYTSDITSGVSTGLNQKDNCSIITYRKLQELKYQDGGRAMNAFLQNEIIGGKPPELKGSAVCGISISR